MNQILISEKIYVTPELKRKKKLYKFNFIISILFVIALFGYYVYGEYDRASEDKSEEIISQIDVVKDETLANAPVKLEDDVLVVMLDDAKSQEEVKIEELNNSEKLDTKVYKTKNGDEYTTEALIKIPSINIEYPVIYSNNTSAKAIEDLLKISVVKYWGPDANKPGNFCIVGHNYHNKKFFSKAAQLETGDRIYITDKNNKTLEYSVYDNYVVDPDNLKCTSQLTNGKTEITLITCTMSGKQRTIIKARAINS